MEPAQIGSPGVVRARPCLYRDFVRRLAPVFVNMAKTNAQPDVLVLGQHPCAYLAACIMLEQPGLTVAHATIPGDAPPDRLVIVNPQLFALHKPLEKVKKKLELTPVYGAIFLA